MSLVRLGVVLVFSVVLMACEGLPIGPQRTFQDGTETVPGPGYYYVTADPVIAVERLVIRSFGPDGQESARDWTFEPGERVAFEGASQTSTRGLTVNGQVCEGTFPLALDRETDVVLELSGETCRVIAGQVHPPGAPSHEE